MTDAVEETGMPRDTSTPNMDIESEEEGEEV